MQHTEGAQPVPVAYASELLDQTIDVIEALGPHFGSDPTVGRSSVGAHVRHVLDHYQSFFKGLACGRIDYYARDRDVEVQTDPATAIRAIQALRARIANHVADRLDEPIRVGTGGPEHRDGASGWAVSSVRRELAFCVSHTLHHLAIIKMVASEFGTRLPDDIGVAHSTRAHQSAPFGPVGSD